MKIIVGNVTSRLTDQNLKSKKEARLVKRLIKLCTVQYEYTGRVHTAGGKSYPQKRVISKRYYDFVDNRFPTGWLPRIAKLLPIEIEPLSDIPRKVWHHKFTGKLRPYQKIAVSRCCKAGRGIIAHPIGSGKSVEIRALISLLGVHTLVIVPKLDLLHKMHDDLIAEFAPEGSSAVGVIGEGSFKPGTWMTVATPQTLWKRRDTPGVNALLNAAQCVIFDECHHINIRQVALGYKWVKAPDGMPGVTKIKSFEVNTWYRLAGKMNQAYYRFGFSATPGDPGSPERRMLEAMTGSVLHKLKSKTLAKKGYLAEPKIHIYTTRVPTYTDWNDVCRYAISENEKRNALIKKLVEKELDDDRRVLVIVDRVMHGRTLWKMIPEAKLVTGKVAGKVRGEILEGLRLYGCVIGTVFDEGSDIPELDTVVLASAGKSPRRLLQRIGRVLRPAKGKDAKVIDFLDDDSIQEGAGTGILWRQSFKRIQVYKAQEYNVKVYTKPEPKTQSIGLLGRKKK